MNTLIDILLPAPLPDSWLSGLLFTAFALHLIFALLALGTALFVVSRLTVCSLRGTADEDGLDQRIARTFLAHKSLAVVLGVAPLLLIQVGRTVPIFSAINLVATGWLLLIVLLITAFVLFDLTEHLGRRSRVLQVVVGLLSLTALLGIPGIFVAMVTVAENAGSWSEMVSHGYRLTGPLALHWFARYLHVLGAAVVVAGLFHYFYSATSQQERSRLASWIVAGLLGQVVLGVLLYASLPLAPERISLMLILGGATLAMLLLWRMFSVVGRNAELGMAGTVSLAVAMLMLMLLARQAIQDRGMATVLKQAKESAVAYQKQLAPYQPQALADYHTALTQVAQRGDAIYAGSCTFCHGATGEGNGAEAAQLAVPPEKVAQIRTTRSYLYQLIAHGVPGSGMPYFAVFDRNKLEGLIDDLHQRYQILHKPAPVSVKLSTTALEEARQVYQQTCSGCHGADGRGTAESAQFKPAPPDFRYYSLTPARTFEVVSTGYPGTMMAAYGNLPEETRWALVRLLHAMRIE